MQPTDRNVIFDTTHGLYNAGEEAHFTAAEAGRLVSLGIARYADVTVTDPAPAHVEADLFLGAHRSAP